MKHSDVVTSVKLALEVNHPILVLGQPGVGKSSLVKQLAEERDWELRDVRAALLDPVDVMGLPNLEKESGTVTWHAPEMWPTKGEGILFLDELPQASLEVQKALSQLILDRTIGTHYRLPDGWRIVAAGNFASDGAGANELLSQNKTRLIQVTYDNDCNEWLDWAYDNHIMPEITAFIRFRPALLHDMEDLTQPTFPTPRTWEFSSDILKLNPPSHLELELLKGIVGDGAATELRGFLQIYRQMSSPDEILANPATARVPEDPASLYAVTGALSYAATEDTIDAITTYADRLPLEFAVSMMRMCPLNNESILCTEAYIDWAAKNKEAFFS